MSHKIKEHKLPEQTASNLQAPTAASVNANSVNDKTSGLTAISIFFLIFLLGSTLYAASTGRMAQVNEASFKSAEAAVTLALKLIGAMAFWLGMVRVLEAGGLLYSVAKLMRPVMVRLFPDVPADHPAMGAMILNLSANFLGLGNAATPMGIKAMKELDRLNPMPGTATNAMCLFLAINTSCITLLPLGTINIRAVAGASQPAAIFLPTLIAHTCATLVGISVALFLSRRDKNYTREFVDGSRQLARANIKTDNPDSASDIHSDFQHLRLVPSHTARWIGILSWWLLTGLGVIAVVQSENTLQFLRNEIMSSWLMPWLIASICCYGLAKGVKVYEAVTEGAKQGFDTAVRIIPYLVAMLVAVGMFQASGAMDLFVSSLTPLTSLFGMPPETLPMALIRPLSGSGASGVMTAILQKSPNSYEAYVASTMMGAADTTFYILAVYFGAIGVTKVRHALVAGLAADITGMIMACIACRWLWQAISM